MVSACLAESRRIHIDPQIMALVQMFQKITHADHKIQKSLDHIEPDNFLTMILQIAAYFTGSADQVICATALARGKPPE